MAQLDPVVLSKISAALEALAKVAAIDAAYLFGSHVEGRADAWSDIDLAVFVPGCETWDFEMRASVSARVQRVAGDDIELHFFSPALLVSAPSAGFAEYVKTTGMQMFPLSSERAPTVSDNRIPAPL